MAIKGSQFHGCWQYYDDARRDAVLDALSANGIGWVRIDAAWDGIEEAKGERNAWYVAMLDRCISKARARGMRVLVTLWLTPRWAGPQQHGPPNRMQDYGDFCRWAAGRWKGQVSAWEVWNEPDPQQSFWSGTVEQYVALLQAGYAGFKAGDPFCKVVLGGPSSNDSRWLRSVYQLGGGPYFDVASTHPYQGIADKEPEFPDDGHRWWFTHYPQVRKVMREYGDGQKPLWFGEFGWSAHGNDGGEPNWRRGVTEQVQADYARRAFQYMAAKWPRVTVAFWYKSDSQPGSGNVHEEGYGLLRADLSARPVLAAIRDA